MSCDSDTQDSLLLAERRRTLEREKLIKSAKQATTEGPGPVLSLHPPPPPAEDFRRSTTPEFSSSLLSVPDVLPRRNTFGFPLAPSTPEATTHHRGYSPRTSPSHGHGAGSAGCGYVGSSNAQFVQQYLTEIERKKNMREIAAAAEKVS